MKAKYIYPFFSLILMISCEKEIKLNRAETEPIITLNGVLMSDTTVSIHLSKTRFFLDSSTDFPDIKDADIILTSGNRTEQLKHTGNGNYTSDYIVRTGDKVELKVTADGLPSVSAFATIPTKPQVGEVSTESSYNEYTLKQWDYTGTIDIGTADYQDINFKIPITDNGRDNNFYRLAVLKVEHYSENTQQSYLSYFIDPIFYSDFTEDLTGMTGQSNTFNIFSDLFFNGSTYQLTFSDRNLKEVKLLPQYEDIAHLYTIPDRVVYQIQIQQLSYEYFMYLKTRNAYVNSDDNPFMEPIQIFSNIENGAGILGGVAVSTIVVEAE